MIIIFYIWDLTSRSCIKSFYFHTHELFKNLVKLNNYQIMIESRNDNEPESNTKFKIRIFDLNKTEINIIK